MSVKLPPSFIDELLSRIDLIDIIEPRITLKKTGKSNYSALCPFHSEKSPSFSVSQAKQFYYCFGCKASGNAIGFLMAYDKLTFLEAVDMLASTVGLAMPEQQNHIVAKANPNLDLLEQCTLFYQKQLGDSASAQQYLQQRGLSSEIISLFRLGFAKAGWDNLQKALSKDTSSKKRLLDIGMLAEKTERGTYDRFRERIMFPIRNRRGQIIAFGGRSLGDEMPKYLNSPETPFFHKSKELYGLFEALQTHKEFNRIIIVEGYLDVMAMHQYGFTETVGTLGTAISLQHIQTILRYTKSLIFCFDGDLAGKKAAWRALEIALPLMHTGLEVLFLFLPNGEDPDSFVRKEGSSSFNQKIQEAIPLVDFFFQKLQSETKSSTLAGKTRFVYLIDKYLQKQPQGIFKELMYERLSEVIGLNKEKILELLNKPETSTKIEPPPSVTPRRLSPPIRLALCLLLQDPKLAKNLPIKEDIFKTITLDGIDLIGRILTLIQEAPDPTTGSLLEYLKEDPEKNLYIELATQDLLIPAETWQEELQGAFDCIIKIDRETCIQTLLTKGKTQGLTFDEKKLLQNLLISQKQL